MPTLNYGAALTHQGPLPGPPVGGGDALRPLLLFDQVLLVLAQHQAVLHLVAARDVVQVLQLLQDVVRQVHVRDALLGDAGQLRLLEIENLIQRVLRLVNVRGIRDAILEMNVSYFAG